MSEKEDKARKLKEIQDRLAEIQKKSSTSKRTSEDAGSKIKEEKKSSPPPPPEKEKKMPAERIINPIVGKTEKPAASVRPKKILTQEEKNWQANRLKDKSRPAAARKVSALEKDGITLKKKSSLSKIYTAISLVVTLVVCSYFIYVFFLSPDKHTEETIESAIPEIVEEKTPDETEIQSGNNSSEEQMDDELMVEDNLNQDEIAEEEPVETIVVEEKPPPPVKHVEQKSNPVTVEAKVPNGMIISYASNSTKKIALKNVAYLKGKGFDAAYYYMPDKNPNSPSLYKVYVGPYKDESAAMPDFRKIVDINDKAFILRMN